MVRFFSPRIFISLLISWFAFLVSIFRYLFRLSLDKERNDAAVMMMDGNGSGDGKQQQRMADCVVLLKDSLPIEDVNVIARALIKAHVEVTMLEDRMLGLHAKPDALKNRAEFEGMRRVLAVDKRTRAPFTVDTQMSFHNYDNEMFFTPAERVSLLLNLVHKTLHDQESLTKKYGAQKLLKAVQIVPLHNPHYMRRLQREWVFNYTTQPIWLIHEYFGDSVAFYFAFLETYTDWLIPAALAGTGVYLYQNVHGLDNAVTYVYGLVQTVWITFTVEHWKRVETRLAFEWDVMRLEKLEEDSEDFKKRATYDEVHERYIVSGPKKVMGYCGSLFVCLSLVSLAAITLVFFLKLGDYAKANWSGNDYQYGLWPLAVHVPVVLYTMVIVMSSAMFQTVAVKVTKWEMHRTNTEAEDAVTVKLVALQFVNYFIGPAWIAFVIRDMDALRAQVISLLCFSIFVGQFTEVVLPAFTTGARVVGVMNQDKTTAGESTNTTTTTITTSDSQSSSPVKILRNGTAADEDIPHDTNRQRLLSIKTELTLEEYAGVYSDYLEMWIQMGMTTLFATVFPFAAALALFNNVIEIRSDAYKVLVLSRRPIPLARYGIGSWVYMFEFLGYASVMFNCALIGVIFVQSPRSAFLFDGHGWEAWHYVLVLVAIEHCFFALKIGMAKLIPDIPDEIAFQIRKELKSEDAAKAEIMSRIARLREILSNFRAEHKTMNEMAKTLVNDATKGFPMGDENKKWGHQNEANKAELIRFVIELVKQKLAVETDRKRLDHQLKTLLQAKKKERGFMAPAGGFFVLLNITLGVVSLVLILGKQSWGGGGSG